jgi:hypothetical protein
LRIAPLEAKAIEPRRRKIAKKGRKRFVFQRPEDFRRLKNKFLTLGVLGVLAV